MSDFSGMEDLLQDFLQEASDLLSDVDNKLVDLEKDPGDRRLLNGPVVNAGGRSDVVVSQQQVDDLLDSLGF